MTQNQIRFVRTLTATWKVLRDPVLTTIYTKKWKNRKDKLQTIYGYVFREMYKAAWCPTREWHLPRKDISSWWILPTTDEHGQARTDTETRRTRIHGIYISLVLCSSVRFSGRTIPAEVSLSAGDITHHGRARTDTETQNIYPFFRVVQCSSVVKSSPRLRGENSSLFLFLPKGYRRDAEGLTKIMYQSNW